MISEERFLDRLSWLAQVTGARIARDKGKYLWDELKNGNPQDFERAVKDMAYSDERINLSTLNRLMNGFASERIEREAREAAQAEYKEHLNWWRSHKQAGMKCINDGNCGACERIYCDIVSAECTNMIKKLITGDIDSETMDSTLAEKFKGIGFGKEEPF